MNLRKLKENKLVFNLYVGYKKKMCSFLTHIAPVRATKYVYKYNTGKKLNLKNPQTFNEKLQWLKLYGDNQLMIQCADKYRVREYIEKKGCTEILNTLYGVYDLSLIHI